MITDLVLFFGDKILPGLVSFTVVHVKKEMLESSFKQKITKNAKIVASRSNNAS